MSLLRLVIVERSCFWSNFWENCQLVSVYSLYWLQSVLCYFTFVVLKSETFVLCIRRLSIVQFFFYKDYNLSHESSGIVLSMLRRIVFRLSAWLCNHRTLGVFPHFLNRLKKLWMVSRNHLLNASEINIIFLIHRLQWWSPMWYNADK